MKTPQKPGPRAGRIAEMLRVDHAGEYGAVAIYRGQRAVFDKLTHKAETAALLKEMEEGEHHHLSTFDALLADRKVRPTLLAPFWNAAGFGLGAATALMGEKAAMACTAAVEDVIEKHYAEQIGELETDEPALAETVREFRDDELEHKHTAETHGAQEAPGYNLLSSAIRFGCRAAIRIAEKV
ncbi:demethoxyubiquinone hydroxylase family protein [Hyphococcus luteus]|uniref:3-demethoxyubiquinol 3-hydroxylase n=1 Tax=Hyphococcus luteus TaxID=2058213 RepID=A0A2S7K6N4_9PROT|nr:demethoxyubiquinone hydroxylase family protein [Marinicaulis flavus]PQA88152.1 demethoxyubiquinone hydroxylase family protein [Marinicaulis flavus]